MTTSQMPSTDTYTIDELERHVVAAALADTDVLEQVSVRLSSRLSGELKSLFNAAFAYFSVTRGKLTLAALKDILIENEPDPTKHQKYVGLYHSLTQAPYTEVTESDRRWFLHQFDLEWQRQWTGEALAHAAEAMKDGHEVKGGQRFTGASAAWKVLAEHRLDFDQLTSGGRMHEAEISSSTDHAASDYERAIHAEHRGIPLALPECMAILRGVRHGEMHCVAGYAGEGKSFLLTNDGHAAWMEGANVAVATGEMPFQDYRTRLLALHSTIPKIGRPIESEKIDSGELNDEEYDVFKEVLNDWKTNPDYGKLFVFQFPFRSTPTLIFNKFAAFDQIVPIDMGIIDYLGLMASEQRRVQRREELDDLVRQCKALALDFGDGRGLALEVAFQTNRASYFEALREGHYTLACFSECAEMEKSADTAQWLLNLPQNPTEIKSAFIKNRHGPKGDEFFLRQNFAYSQITSLRSSRPGGTKPAPTGGPDVSVLIPGT